MKQKISIALQKDQEEGVRRKKREKNKKKEKMGKIVYKRIVDGKEERIVTLPKKAKWTKFIMF